MTKLINLMPLMMKMDETTSFESSFARVTEHPSQITDEGVRVRLENDTEATYLESGDLDGADRDKYYELFEKFSADHPEINELAKQVHDYQVDELGNAPRWGGYEAILDHVINYLVGLRYGSYLREKYGADSKVFVGSADSYDFSIVDPVICRLWGITGARPGYSDVLMYRYIKKHHYYKNSVGYKKSRGGRAIASTVFVRSQYGDSIFGSYGSGTPSIIKVLWKVIGSETPAALSESS